MSNGIIFYEGPSVLDGAPIVGIALAKSTNRKTGDLVQTYIIRSDMHPQDAMNEGLDASICGECPHKKTEGTNGRTCYVFAPSIAMVYKSFKAGKYEHLNDRNINRFIGRKVRLGSYGDPCAIPESNWLPIISLGEGHTSYSHQWKDKNINVDIWRLLTMASVETVELKLQANEKGFKTYRVGKKGDKPLRDEMLCPASKEAGKALTCDQCMRCNGNSKNIFIPVHGTTAVINKFERT